MTRRWPHMLWVVPALAALGLGTFVTVRSDSAGPAPAAMADMAPCDSCAARHQRVTRIAGTRMSGALP